MDHTAVAGNIWPMAVPIINVVAFALGAPEKIERRIACPTFSGLFTKVMFSAQADEQLLVFVELFKLFLCFLLRLLSL